MFGPLGGPEILLILVLALIVFGPRRLPEIGKSMGRMLAEFRKASNDFKRTIEDEVEADKLRSLTQIETPLAETPRPQETSPAPEAGPVEPPAAPAPGIEAPRIAEPEGPTVSRDLRPAEPK